MECICEKPSSNYILYNYKKWFIIGKIGLIINYKINQIYPFYFLEFVKHLTSKKLLGLQKKPTLFNPMEFVCVPWKWTFVWSLGNFWHVKDFFNITMLLPKYKNWKGGYTMIKDALMNSPMFLRILIISLLSGHLLSILGQCDAA